MLKKYYTICFGALLLFACQCVSAQTPTEKAKEVSGRKAWLVATSMPDDVSNPLKILSNNELHEVKIYLRSIVHPVKVDDTGIVRAVKEIVSDNGQVSYENLSLSTLPEGVREALIVLVPRKDGAAGLRFNSKVIDLAEFKGGGCLYVNLVGTKIGIVVGEHKALVKPGEMKFINALGEKEKEAKLVSFFYEVPKEEEWKLMNSFKKGIY
jgi:hypothetical protein